MPRPQKSWRSIRRRPALVTDVPYYVFQRSSANEEFTKASDQSKKATMNNLASAGLSIEELIGQAANEFFGAVSRGEMPSITEFASRYPDISEHIRCAFPALLLVGNFSADEQATVPAQLHGDRSLG